jgi:hypothetical protein
VEVFFFQDGIDPMPGATNSQPAAPEYAAWNDAVEEERTFTPSLAGRGMLRIDTDVEFEWASESQAVFVLRAVDGSYETAASLADNAIGVDGYVVVELRDLPCASFYTLTIRYTDGNEEVAFSDIPYPELARVGDDELVDPFSGKPVGGR